MSRSCVALGLAALLLVALPARAQVDKAAAEALFREGQQAMDRKDYATACSKFADSQRAEPAPGTLFFLADCEEKRGRLATAWALFRELEQKLPDSDKRKPTVVDRANALESRVKRLTVELSPGAPADAVVTRDGVPHSLGAAIPVDPGPHVIVVEAKGRKRSETTIEMAGEDQKITVEVGPSEEPPPPKPLPASTPPGDERVGSFPMLVGGLTMVGIGGAAALSGIVVGAVANSDYRKSNEDGHCDEDDFCDAEGLAIRKDARFLGDAATVVFFTGIGIAAVGTVLALVSPTVEIESASTNRVQIGVGASSVIVRGTW